MDKPPYDPEALPPELRRLIPQNYRLPTEPKNVVTPRCQTKPVLPKSYAQVESMVSPPAAAPYSGGLKPGIKRRRNPLTVRLSRGEWEKIASKAIRAGCTLNSYARAAMLGSDYTPPRDPELVKVLRKYYFELHMLGINLNQIAKQLNAGVISSTQGEALMVILARQMSQMHRAVLKALAHGKGVQTFSTGCEQEIF